jgi:two-component system OmpR family sensor kinase
MSLRTRLLAGVAAVAVMLVVVAALVTRTTRAHLVDQVDHRLQVAAGEDRDERFGRRDDHPRPPEGGPDAPERLSDLYEGVVDSDGSVVWYLEPNIGLPQSPPDTGLLDAHTLGSDATLATIDSVDGTHNYRAYARTRSDGTVFVTAAPLDDVDDAVRRLVLLEGLGVLAIAAVLGAVAWWMLRLGIRPINRMAAAARDIAASDLAVRVPDARPGTEAGELARAINGMLGRIETAVADRARSEERLRRFVADASHELRTPVTTIRGYAELYALGGLGQTDELDDAMRRTRDEAERMGRLIEEMLALAKLDEGRALSVESVDLAGLMADAARDARVVAPDRVITLATEAAVVSGDRDRLRQVIGNLVSNALAHTPVAAAVHLWAGPRNGEGVLEVRDEGPGMTPDVVERVTERFYRADPSRARTRGGSGLGMAIVDAVVGAHGGRLEIDTEPGRGTIVTVSLPIRGFDFSPGTPDPLPAGSEPALSE